MEIPDGPIRAVLFDLWNTLVFTDGPPNPITELAAAFGLDARPGWRRRIERAMMTRRLSGIGDALDALAAVAGLPRPGGQARRELTLMWGEACNRSRLYPDVLPALRLLRRAGATHLKVGVLSNTQSFDLDFIRREGLAALVDEMCLSCDGGWLKPEDRAYRHAATRLGVPPGQVLMVGDNVEDDVEGPTRARMKAVLLDRAGRARGSIASLAELHDRLTG